jgi:hypothetical protein
VNVLQAIVVLTIAGIAGGVSWTHEDGWRGFLWSLPLFMAASALLVVWT